MLLGAVMASTDGAADTVVHVVDLCDPAYPASWTVLCSTPVWSDGAPLSCVAVYPPYTPAFLPD